VFAIEAISQTALVPHSPKTKTRLGPVNDPLEREADRAADAVVAGRSAGALSSTSASPKSKEANSASAPPHATDLAANSIAEGGAPLTKDQRAYFEPRFGKDLSQVRLHTHDMAAAGATQINARAYAVQNNIGFASGEYLPHTPRGKHLLAHEIAHTLQQQDGSTIRRVVRTDPRAPAQDYFTHKGLKSFTVDGNIYSASRGNAVSAEQEVLIDMLASPRAFNVDGGSSLEVEKSLEAHVKARLGIVAFAAQKKYSFASVTNFKMNPQYYNTFPDKQSWALKPGADKQTAWDDLNVNPQQYAIGCAAATELTQVGGSKGAKFLNQSSGDEGDWVAGDAGYVINKAFTQGADIGYLGENIIYAGQNLFWGHFSGNLTYRTLQSWKAEVSKWHGGGKASAAEVDTKREIPMTGLL
jgi:hypothetical protein